MALTFRDNFSGSGALNSHTPDTTSSGQTLTAVTNAGHAQLYGGHLISDNTGTIQIQFNPTGVAFPYDFFLEGITGWNTGGATTYPIDNGLSTAFHFYLYNGHTILACNIFKANTSFSGYPVGFNGGGGTPTNPAGIYLYINSTFQNGTDVSAAMIDLSGFTAPYTLQVHATAAVTTWFVNGTLVYTSTTGTFGLPTLLNIDMYPNQGLDGLATFAATPPASAFWTGFLQTTEVP